MTNINIEFSRRLLAKAHEMVKQHFPDVWRERRTNTRSPCGDSMALTATLGSAEPMTPITPGTSAGWRGCRRKASASGRRSRWGCHPRPKSAALIADGRCHTAVAPMRAATASRSTGAPVYEPNYRRIADHVYGYDRDDPGESPDY
jgi:hypothetical protein